VYSEARARQSRIARSIRPKIRELRRRVAETFDED
jgi:hypothetical protein